MDQKPKLTVLLPKMNLLYFIATIPRSGSGWLVHMLRNTEVVGYPDEYFNDDHIYQKTWNELKDEPIVGIKLTDSAFNQHHKTIDPCIFSSAKYIFLKRKNKLEQAISGYRAEETRIWNVQNEVSRKEYDKCSVTFSEKRILRILRVYKNSEVWWEKWFRNNNVVPLRVWYEDILENPEKEVRSIIKFLGKKAPKNLKLKTELQVLRDARTDSWVRYFTDVYSRPELTGASFYDKY